MSLLGHHLSVCVFAVAILPELVFWNRFETSLRVVKVVDKLLHFLDFPVPKICISPVDLFGSGPVKVDKIACSFGGNDEVNQFRTKRSVFAN